MQQYKMKLGLASDFAIYFVEQTVYCVSGGVSQQNSTTVGM